MFGMIFALLCAYLCPISFLHAMVTLVKLVAKRGGYFEGVC